MSNNNTAAANANKTVAPRIFGWRHSDLHGERPQAFFVLARTIEEAREKITAQYNATEREISEIVDNLPPADDFDRRRCLTERDRAFHEYALCPVRSTEEYVEIRFPYTVPLLERECLDYVLNNPPDVVAGMGCVLACSAMDQ